MSASSGARKPDSPDQAPGTDRRQAPGADGGRRLADEGVLPDRAAEDSDTVWRWSDGADTNDERLLRERPPHWE